jgi:hypothetical protein
MPEAPIDKHGDLVSGEDNVWPHLVSVESDQEIPSVPQPSRMQDFPNGDLRARVTPAVRLHVGPARVGTGG